VIRGVGAQKLELRGIVRRSIFGNPQLGYLEVLVAQHVEQWNLAHHCAEQIWPLRECRTHQQAAVAAALDRQMLSVSIFFCDQVFRSGKEIVKNILLLLQHAIAMPVFAKLIAAAKLHVNINAALLQQQ